MPLPDSPAPALYVLAGVNGAGKSSVGGAMLVQLGMTFFNPDDIARRIRQETSCSVEEANARAWMAGKERLEAAIRARSNFAFETTLGGNTIPRLIARAARGGFEVFVVFVGLSSPEQHIARVRARVAAGGHDIPEANIRERWNTSRRNLIALLPHLTELRVFDNSVEGNPRAGTIPPPRELLHWNRGTVTAPRVSILATTPEWARPIVIRALQLARTRNR